MISKLESEKIQILRGISILAVIMIHNSPPGIEGVILRNFTNFCVAMFIFLSGFLTSDEIIFDTIKKRIIRVFIPYFIWSIIFFVVSNDYKNFVYKIFTGQCCGIYYYILVYIQLTILIPASIKLMKSNKWYLGFCITPAAIIIEYILKINDMPIQFPYNANLFVIWYNFFYLGLCIRNNVLQTEKMNKNLLGLGLLGGYILTFFESLYWYSVNDYNLATTQVKLSNMFLSTIICLLAVIWIKNDVEYKCLGYKILEKIGNFSFGIYLTHILLMNIFNRTLYVIVGEIPFFIKVTLILIIEMFAITSAHVLFGEKLCNYIGF